MTKDGNAGKRQVVTGSEPPLAVWAEEASLLDRAESLASELAAPLVRKRPGSGLVLRVDAGGLALGTADMAPAHMLRGDFTRMLPRLRPDRLGRELLVRAARIRRTAAQAPVALDATAGLGEDALLLAAAGFVVHLYEYNPLIAALLADALDRMRAVPELAFLAGRLLLHQEDSLVAMQRQEFRPDIVLLDPMFPARQKSAKVRKKLQLLQQVEAPCTDEAALVQAALALQPCKVLIKRPLKGPPLAGLKPACTFPGKAIRFDCLLPPPGPDRPLALCR